MNASPTDYEKLGQFYLGRGYHPDTKQADGDLLLYDSKDLVTHGVVLGMTGSGKTGLCLTLLEEAALDRIPAIVIDPKGDIPNLLLAFPNLDAASFRPWINEDDAAKKGVSPDVYAEQTATTWKSGLAAWGQSPERIAAFREAADISIFTPGSSAGIPVSILSSLDAPPSEIMNCPEMLGERIETTVSSLLSLVGSPAEGNTSPQAVLLAAIFQQIWTSRQALTLESLIRHIQSPPFDKIGVMDLESFMPAKDRQSLALRFNSLLASPGFAAWLEGPPLDIAGMLHTTSGKPRISIFSIAHLGDTERMFFVSLLLNQMLGWMRAQNGTTSLRALLYMDEIFGFLPPSANPPSKRPLMTILKQGRAFGLGALLATQNPVDLDYKGLSNIGTWFIGRLQTERDKLRVLDGLEGAAGAQRSSFDRSAMERLISGLGNRIFLMNNVHEDGPVLFHVRWVMSYLTGPLTRAQIKLLMDPKRDQFESASPAAPMSNPMTMPGFSEPSSAGERPAVGNGVREFFVHPIGHGEIIYHPYLVREATVHFSLTKADFEETRHVALLNPITQQGVDWDHPLPLAEHSERHDDPAQDAKFSELPGFAMNAANYRQVEKDFSEWLYRNERAEILNCPELKAWSKPGEPEAEFRVRMVHRAREARDAAVGKLREAASKKIATLENRLRTAEAQLAKQKAEAGAAKMQAGVSILGGLLGGLLGRKTALGALTRGSSAINKASGAYKQHQDVSIANARIDDINEEIQQLKDEMSAEAANIAASYEPDALKLESETIKPSRSDIHVENVALLWMSHVGDPSTAACPKSS